MANKLSNTATPKYYGIFRQSVIDGVVPVSETVALQMKLIDNLIASPLYYYDEEAVEGFIKFCEEELTLTDGSPMFLLDTFKLWAEDVFGWYYFIERSVPLPNKNGRGVRYVNKKIKKRLRNKQYLIIARGAAKSVYDSCMHSFMLTVNTATTKQIVTAPTMRQAEETLAPIRTALARQRGPLFKFLCEGSINNTNGSKANRPKLASTKKGIQNFLTESIVEVLPMSIDKLQGYRPFMSTVDEWLSGDVREDVCEAIEQGASKLDDYLIILTSSEGTVRNGPGDSIKIELMKILKGEYINPHVSIWWYKLDDVKEVAQPDLWIKAQPNLGKTVSWETYQLAVEKAENSPDAKNDILAKRFGLPMEGYTYFFTYKETLPINGRADYWKMPCSMGADLSQGNDFCAFTFLFPLGYDKFGVKTLAFITQRTLDSLPLAMRNKYDEFIQEGSLLVHDGTILDLDNVYDDLDRHIISHEYDVRCVGYDPYNARSFIERWELENGPYGIEKVIQGAKTETVPLGEMKNLAEDGKLLHDQKLMTFCMGNCIVIRDNNGGRKLMKLSYDKKIDCVSAEMDAFIAYKLNKDAFD